jgi:hypothetical protein
VLVYANKKKSKFGKIRKTKKASGEHLYYFFNVPLTLLYTITSSWCGRFNSPCIKHLIIYCLLQIQNHSFIPFNSSSIKNSFRFDLAQTIMEISKFCLIIFIWINTLHNVRPIIVVIVSNSDQSDDLSSD